MMKYFILYISLFILQYQAKAICNLAAPQNLQVQSIGSCLVEIKWNMVAGAADYNIKYKLSSSGIWTSIDNIGLVTSYVISGLDVNSSYSIKVTAVCANGEEGDYSNLLFANTPFCSVPTNLSVSNISSYAATVSWTVPCGESLFKVKYRKMGTSTWTVRNNITGTSLTLNNLASTSSYQVKVQSICGAGMNSAFSTAIQFSTTGSTANYSDRNVLLIIIDDARYDSYEATNGPEFFSNPNISRIANEGANFKLSFPAQSTCAASRASVLTGVYPHIHGIKNNPQDGATDTITLTTLPQILHSNGYYTGLIGKYHLSKWPQPGYNYWMEQHKSDYFDAKYNVNGADRKIKGHQTDILTDSVIGFLHKVPENQPFFLWLGYRAPHTPYVPRPEDSGLFDNDTMPFPSNFQKYDINYPDFLYNCHNSPPGDTVREDYRGYFEMLNGIEVNLGRIWEEMENLGIMDSTLIIFMSDNGYMMGEHHFVEKQLAYEESIKIPLFMRYPKLIGAGKNIKKDMAMNIDIAPTILDFAGIPDTFNMQGVSLLKMINKEVSRKELMYEWHHQECVPDIRAIRSLNCKYVQYYCSDTTEEFFDLNYDKKENNNLIYTSSYSDSVQIYRDKLAFWRNYYEDYSYDSLYICNLTNIQQRSLNSDDEPLTLLNVFPNPSSDHFTIHFMSAESATATIRMVNAIGNVLYEEIIQEPRSEITRFISTEKFAGGNYFVVVQHATESYTKSIFIE